MNFAPVETFDHIVIGPTGKAWALFRLSGPPGLASYRFHSDAALVGYAHQALGWIRGLPTEARILSVATPVSSDVVAAEVAAAPALAARLSEDRRRALADQAISAGRAADANPSHRRRHYLAVTLDDADTFRSNASETLAQVAQLAGRRRPASSPARRRQLLRAADLLATALGPLVEPADQYEIRWLLARAVRRSLPDEPPEPKRPRRDRPARSRAGRPAPTGVPARPLVDALLIEGGSRGPLGLARERQVLQVQSGSGVSYQTTLVMAAMPPEWSFPDNGYWMAAVDDFAFPVDVTVRVHSPPQHETRRQFRRRHKELAGQPDQYAGTTSGVPDSVYDLIDRSNAAQTALDTSRLNRIHRTLVCYTVAAADPEQLAHRVAAVRADLGAGGYELHTPTGDQRDLFFLGLPGTAIRPGGVVADYDLDLTAEAIASGLPGFAPALGDDTGALLGHRCDIGAPLPVLLSPSVETSASTMGFGSSGGGKSFTAKTIALQELTGGAQVVAIDRSNRGEYVQFAAGLPSYLSSEVVDLSGVTNLSLCPMSTFAPAERGEITTSFLCLLAGVGSRTMESARIAQATEAVDRRNGSTRDVLDLLLAWGDGGDDLARDLYYRIVPLARTRFARLAFQPGAGVSVRGSDLIVLHAQGLVLPSREEIRSGDDLDASKAASIAMVYLLMALADTIGNATDRLSSIVLDEAWAFLDSSFGIELANRVLRDGRKDFKKLQLWSQHPADAPPELLNMASNVFLTRQVEGAGAAALTLVGAEPTPELVAMIEQLPVGQMVMRDEHGRLGVVRISPPVDPRMARAFDTRPRSGHEFAPEAGRDLVGRGGVGVEGSGPPPIDDQRDDGVVVAGRFPPSLDRHLPTAEPLPHVNSGAGPGAGRAAGSDSRIGSGADVGPGADWGPDPDDPLHDGDLFRRLEASLTETGELEAISPSSDGDDGRAVSTIRPPRGKRTSPVLDVASFTVPTSDRDRR
jgi:hypothetical protein